MEVLQVKLEAKIPDISLLNGVHACLWFRQDG